MGALAGGGGARIQAEVDRVGAVPPPGRLYAALSVALREERLLHAFHVHLRLLLAPLRLYEHRATVRGIVGLPGTVDRRSLILSLPPFFEFLG